MNFHDPIVTITFTLPISKARSLLEKLGSDYADTAGAMPDKPTTAQIALLMAGKGGTVIKSFVTNDGSLYNADLAAALDLSDTPAFTFKPLATLTLRLRKLGYPDKDWYTREKRPRRDTSGVNAGSNETLLRLRSDVLELFRYVIEK